MNKQFCRALVLDRAGKVCLCVDVPMRKFSRRQIKVYAKGKAQRGNFYVTAGGPHTTEFQFFTESPRR